MQSNDSRPLCRCGCGVLAHRDTGFARGQRPCLGTPEQRFWARVVKSDTCWEWAGAIKEAGSYGRFRLDDQWIRAHRFAWAMATGEPIPDGFDVLHTCDVRHCVRNDDAGEYVVNGIAYERRGHLWLGDHVANMADMQTKGRVSRAGAGMSQPRGERIGCAKLNEDDVRAIRRLLSEGRTLRSVAEQFGVSKGPITGIARGVLWKHVQ